MVMQNATFRLQSLDPFKKIVVSCSHVTHDDPVSHTFRCNNGAVSKYGFDKTFHMVQTDVFLQITKRYRI